MALDRARHQVAGGVVAGVAEHHPLIGCALSLFSPRSKPRAMSDDWACMV